MTQEQLKIKKQEIITSLLRRKPEVDRIQKQIKNLESCLEDLKKEARDMFDEYADVCNKMLEIEHKKLVK